MSVATGISAADHSDKLHKKSFHRRNDSGELDVFEAARYFSGYNEALGCNGSSFTQKIMKQEEHRGWRGGRISLDMPMRNVLIHPHHQPSLHHHHHQHHQMVVMDHKQMMIKDKKHKQPSSPGGRLASFLNSLFSQSASKKKKSKSTTQSMKDVDHDQEESPSGRRRRRSSISHFRSSSTTDSKSIYSSSSSGFRTPPPYISNAQTPTKSLYKDLRSFSSDHKQVGPLSKHKPNNNTGNNNPLQNEQDKYKHSKELNKKNDNLGNALMLEKDKIWLDKYPSEKKSGLIRRFDHHDHQEYQDHDDDDGADSDSSSDLFELPNYDLGCYSSGLPVYETTNMDNIKRSGSVPISNASL